MKITKQDAILQSANKYLKKLPSFKEKKTQQVTTLVLTLVALSFFGLFAINPTISTIAELQKELSDAQDVKTRLEQKIVNLGKLQIQYRTIQTDLPVVLSALPKTPSIPLLTAQLQAIAKSKNVELKNLQIYEVEISPLRAGVNRVSSFNFNTQAVGVYPDLVAFLQTLSDFDRILTFDFISLSKNKDAQTSTLVLTIRARAYFKD